MASRQIQIISEGLRPQESLYPGALSRRPVLLIQSGFGRKKQLWAVDKIENNQPDISGSAFGIATCPSQLCELALSFFALALQAILAQAKAFLHIQLYHIGANLHRLRLRRLF